MFITFAYLNFFVLNLKKHFLRRSARYTKTFTYDFFKISFIIKIFVMNVEILKNTLIPSANP